MFTEELHRDFLDEELNDKAPPTSEKGSIIKQRIKAEGYLNLGDLKVEKQRRKSHVPNVDAFLNNELTATRSESASNALVRRRQHASSKGRNTSEMSENNSLDDLFDHLNPTQFNSSIDEGSHVSHISTRRKPPGPSSFLGDDLKSPRNVEHRDELYSSVASDD